MPNCPSCGKPFARGEKFCSQCGLNLTENYLFEPVCPVCRREYPEGTKYCAVDGTALVDQGAADQRLADKAIVDGLLKDGYSVDIGPWIKRGWELVRPNLGLYIGFFLLYTAVSAIPGIGWAVSLLSSVISAGAYIVALKTARRQPVKFEDFFAGFQMFLPLFLAGLVTGFITMAGFLLLIIPGIYLGIAYFFTTQLIVDRKMDFWAAMETSRKVVTGRWWGIFGFALVLGLINIGGALALLVGLLFTIPLSVGASVAAYEAIFGLAGPSPMAPADSVAAPPSPSASGQGT